MSKLKKGDKGTSARGVADNSQQEPDEDLDWPQTADAYEIKSQIGQGAFARVFAATCIPKGRECAIKVIELDNLTSSLEDIYQEVRVMSLSKHPNVLRAFACFVVKKSLWLVTPLLRKGSCLRILRVLKRAGLGDGIPEAHIAVILKATLEGLAYLHSKNKVHRDIKASNLLVDETGNVMISDFGVASWVPSTISRDEQRRTFVGTPAWMAPEVIEQSAPYNEKADIWSLGITALELAKGMAPYASLSPMKVLLETLQAPPPSLKSYPDYQQTRNKFSRHFREIINLCLQKEAQNRPSAATLLGKNFFKRAGSPSFLRKELLDKVPIPDAVADLVTSPEREAALQKVRQDQKDDIQRQLSRADSATEPNANVSSVPAAAAATTTPQEPATASAPQAAVEPPQAEAPSAGPPGQPNPGTLAKLESKEKGASFVKGATWVFDDDEDDNKDKAQGEANAAAQQQPFNGETLVEESSDFAAFASEYEKEGIKGEDG